MCGIKTKVLTMKHALFALTLLLALNAQAVNLSLDDVLADLPTLNDSLPTPKQVAGVDVGERHWYHYEICLLYTSPSPRDQRGSRMPSSA